MKVKGYIGHVKINNEGKVIESNVDNAEEIAKILKINVEKGNQEAKELGFNKMNGFAMFGSSKSLTFMKDTALVVDSKKADWQELFSTYTYIKSWLIGGIALLVISLILYYLAIFTSYMNYFAPEPRYYTPTILLLISVFMIVLSKSKYSYRL